LAGNSNSTVLAAKKEVAASLELLKKEQEMELSKKEAE